MGGQEKPWLIFGATPRASQRLPVLVIQASTPRPRPTGMPESARYLAAMEQAAMRILERCDDYPEADQMIEERAWSSPIWYLP